MARNLYQVNYARLEALMGQRIEELRSDIVYRLRSDLFMDLVVEVLPRCPETGVMVLSMAHYFEHNRDLCQDPEMTLRAWPPRDGRPALFYGRLDRQPLSIHKFPSSYLFQSAIVSKEPDQWLTGVLVSEVLAKLVMEEFVRIDIDRPRSRSPPEHMSCRRQL